MGAGIAVETEKVRLVFDGVVDREDEDRERREVGQTFEGDGFHLRREVIDIENSCRTKIALDIDIRQSIRYFMYSLHYRYQNTPMMVFFAPLTSERENFFWRRPFATSENLLDEGLGVIPPVCSA